MSRTPPLSEASMRSAESGIPQLAAQAGRAAYLRAMAETGRVVMKSAGGQLVEMQASGEVRVIKGLPASTPAQTGMVLKRTRKQTNSAGGR